MSATRWLVALGCLGLLSAACSQQASGTQIGVRAQTGVSAPAAQFDPSPIDAKLTNQLTETNNIAAIGEDALANGQLPIDTFLTFRQSVRLAELQQLANTLLTQRLTAISAVRYQVDRDRVMSGWQKANIYGLLDNAAAGVNQMQVTIARDQLVDQARYHLTRIGTLRVLGLILPQARMLAVGYQLGQLAAIYANQQAFLQQQIYNQQSAGIDVTVAQSAVNDLAYRIAIIRNSSSAALGVLQSLSVAGYPGNKPSLIYSRGSLLAGKYAGDLASADSVRARAALHI